MIVGLPATGLRLDLDPADSRVARSASTGTMYGSEDPAVGVAGPARGRPRKQLDLASLIGPEYPLDSVDEAVRASLAGSPGRVLVIP